MSRHSSDVFEEIEGLASIAKDDSRRGYFANAEYYIVPITDLLGEASQLLDNESKLKENRPPPVAADFCNCPLKPLEKYREIKFCNGCGKRQNR